ncbi:hypothetical protein OQA88_2469 [Cercophora sp. LCS_1]
MASPSTGHGPPSPGRQSATRDSTPVPLAAAASSLSLSSSSAAAGSSFMEQLPNELLLRIATALVPVSPPTTRFALRPSGTWEFQTANHHWAAWLAGHNALLAFAQTSKRMFTVSQQFLYHTLVIHDAADLVRLSRRMHRRPEIRPWIRELACLANVGGTLTIDQLHREWERQTGGTRQTDQPPPRSALIDQGPVKWKSSRRARDSCIGLALLEDIVLNAPNLQDLLIAFPDHEVPVVGGVPPTLDLLDSPLRDAVSRHIMAYYPGSINALPFVPYLSFLRTNKLRSLRMYCHREELNREISLSRIMNDYAIEHLASFSRLETLEFCCSNFIDFRLDPVFPILPQIKHLRLYGSYTLEPRLVAVCLACVNLETLLVHFELSTDDAERDRLPGGKTLNDALRERAGTLRSLELINLDEGHYLTRGMERPRKPENHRLSCLSALTHLESLTLDYRGLWGTLGVLEEDDGERLCQILPPSLRHFTLICEWGTEKDWKQSYLANLDMTLYGVDCLCGGDFPLLETISLGIHTWPARGRFGKRFRRQFHKAKTRCVADGVKFRSFEIQPCYQDEDEVVNPEDDENEDVEDPEVVTGAGEVEQPNSDEDGDDEDTEELEEEDEASEYYFSGDEDADPGREAIRPKTFDEFLGRLPEDHGHAMDELFYAFHEDRWDEYLF